MKPGDTYDECLRDHERRIRYLAVGLIFSGAASGCALVLAVLAVLP